MPSAAAIRRTVEVDDPAVLLAVTGPRGSHLRALSEACRIDVSQRGTSILLAGDLGGVDLAERYLVETAGLLRDGMSPADIDVARAVSGLRADAGPQALAGEAVHVTTMGKKVVPKGPTQRDYLQAIRNNDLVFGIGPAGTGKTYLAMAMAVAALLDRKVRRIVLTRPAVEAGEKLGFLPGDLAEKVNPYLRPLFDALEDMLDYDRSQALIGRGQIEVAPLAFMRGRTLSDAFVILDEAQNTTTEQMRMFLTRIGHGSRAVVTGDVTQVDLPTGARSGLAEARDLLTGVDGIGFIHFSDVDVVRHPLVQRIVLAYEKSDRDKREKRDAQRAAKETP